jgi:YVTN family beta-propeller protein
VPIYGNSGVGRAGTDGDHIEVIDVPSAKITGTIAFSHGVRPHNPIYDRHTGMLLVTTEIDKTVSIVDPKTMKVVGSIPTGQEQSHMTVLTPDGKKLYSANVGPGTVSVMDVRARKLLKVIPISATTQRIACTPDGKWVFTADQKTTDLVVIDTSKDEIAKRIPLPAKAYGTRPTADGSKLLITMPKTDTIGVLDVKSMTLGTPIAGVPKGLNEIVVSPDGAWAWASSPLENNISIIDMKTMKVTKTFPSGKFVDGLWLIAKK